MPVLYTVWHNSLTQWSSSSSPSAVKKVMPPSSDAATSSGAVPPGTAVSQGKPSLRRIKGRVQRSKSLDSMDLLDVS
ncbi:hypothetical protein Baya_12533 [Bagarius yarrelli]|uniref:Uncharacterized protein n=1 Tax=Bagarius yarrelli TaxID=175774 RepID=A0A556V3H0_BAGYA|nr:hypothetical protein Baya_12533 [Bagarius yarrelli]